MTEFKVGDVVKLPWSGVLVIEDEPSGSRCLCRPIYTDEPAVWIYITYLEHVSAVDALGALGRSDD